MIFFETILRLIFLGLALLSWNTLKELLKEKDCSDCTKDAKKTIWVFGIGVLLPKTCLVFLILFFGFLTLVNKWQQRKGKK